MSQPASIDEHVLAGVSEVQIGGWFLARAGSARQLGRLPSALIIGDKDKGLAIAAELTRFLAQSSKNIGLASPDGAVLGRLLPEFTGRDLSSIVNGLLLNR
jgi:hypothetical protein